MDQKHSNQIIHINVIHLNTYSIFYILQYRQFIRVLVEKHNSIIIIF